MCASSISLSTVSCPALSCFKKASDGKNKLDWTRKREKKERNEKRKKEEKRGRRKRKIEHREKVSCSVERNGR